MCEYCEKGKKMTENEDDKLCFQIYYKHLRMYGKVLNMSIGRDIVINYCPMCGKRLGVINNVDTYN